MRDAVFRRAVLVPAIGHGSHPWLEPFSNVVVHHGLVSLSMASFPFKTQELSEASIPRIGWLVGWLLGWAAASAASGHLVSELRSESCSGLTGRIPSITSPAWAAYWR